LAHELQKVFMQYSPMPTITTTPMNSNGIHRLEFVLSSLLSRKRKTTGGPTGFVAVPVCGNGGPFCPMPMNAQQAGFLMASQQAAKMVADARRRRQAILARDVYLWN
jgi:hypothetical protein